MNELTKYNKVIGVMEQCTVGENLWVKAEEAEQQIAYWKRCVETSKAVHQIDNETIRKQLDTVSKLQGENGDLKVGIDERGKQLEYWRDAYSEMFDHWAGEYDSECAAHTKTLHKLNTARLLANLWACVAVLLAAWELNERVGIL